MQKGWITNQKDETQHDSHVNKEKIET